MLQIFTNSIATSKPLDKYGMKEQCFVWCEECSELIKAVTKLIRNPKGSTKPLRFDYLKSNLTEEIADVIICIEQMKAAYGISNSDIQEWVERKEERESIKYK